MTIVIKYNNNCINTKSISNKFRDLPTSMQLMDERIDNTKIKCKNNSILLMF